MTDKTFEEARKEACEWASQLACGWCLWEDNVPGVISVAVHGSPIKHFAYTSIREEADND